MHFTEFGGITLMAEIRDLTLNVKANTKGLKDISAAGKKSSSDLQKQNKKSESTFSRLTKSIKGSKLALVGLAAGAVIAFIAYRKLSDFIRRSIQESATQDTIFNKLAATLANLGIEFSAVSDRINAMLLQIQRTTRFGDTDTAEVFQTLLAFTRDFDSAERALKTTLDFAEGAHLSLAGASRILAQTLGGNLAAITRYEASLKGISQETFDAMTKTAQLDLVLGALDKKFGGIAVAGGNTYEGALAQLTNAQGDLRESVGDFITQSPVFIALIQEIAESYLGAAEAVAKYREDQEKGNQIALDAINKLEGLALAVNFLVRLLAPLGNVLAVIFGSLGAVATQITATFKNALAGLLNFRLVIASIAEKIPGLGKFALDEGEILAFKKRIADLEKIVTDAGPKLEKSLDGISENFFGFFDNLLKIGDDSGITELFDRVRERAEGLEVSLIPVREILPEVGGALNDAAEDAKKLGDEIQTLTETFQDFVNGNNIFELIRKSNPTQGPETFFDDLFGDAEDLEEAEEEITGTLSAIGVFAADIASNINDAFANTLTELVFDFDNFGDSIKNVLKSIANAFFQMIATFITNPIRIALETSLSGGGAGIVGEATGLGGLLGGLGSSFGALGSLFGIGGAAGGAQALPGVAALLGGGAQAGVGFIATLGAAIPAIGAIIAAAAIAIPLIIKAFEKTPRLDLDFDTFRDEFGKSLGIAAEVGDFLNKELFESEIFNNSVSRQAGLGLKGAIAPVIQEAIEGQIRAIQDIINQLPSDIASLLNDALLSTAVDIESTVKGDRLLEFDETKNIAEKFQKFINGDLQARFLFAIREFFVGAFESLGVLSDSAQNFIDQEFENFQGLNREQRIVAGQELLQDFQTLTDAFNVLNNNGGDAIGATINSLKNLASTLGFDTIPSIEELDRGLQELVNAAELNPSVIQDFLDLRSAILQVQGAILNSISSIIGKISQLNSITGTTGNLGGFINQGLDTTIGILDQGGLSLDDQEALLDIGVGFLNQLIAEEQSIFNAQQAQAQAQAEAFANAQRANITAAIDGLGRERDAIQKNFDLRLEALQEELRLAEDFKSLTESIKNTLGSIILGPDSIFTAIERLNLVQSDIASTQAALNATTDPAKQLELAAKLEESFTSLFDLAGEAFGVNSPEFVAIFDQVTSGLEDLIDLTDSRTRTIEEINASIEALNLERNETLERIDAQIQSSQAQLSAIQTQNVQATFQVSNRVQELAEFFTNEYIDLLNARFEQLGQIDAQGFATELGALNSINATLLRIEGNTGASAIADQEALITLRDAVFLNPFQNTSFPEFAHGSGGFRDFGSGTLAMLHGREAVVRPGDVTTRGGDITVVNNFSIEAHSNNGSSEDVLIRKIGEAVQKGVEDSIRRGGSLRNAVQDASTKRLN